jgi:hypothetical protein
MEVLRRRPNHAMLAMAFSIKKAPSPKHTLFFREDYIPLGFPLFCWEKRVYTPKKYGKHFWPTLNPGFKGLSTRNSLRPLFAL